MPRLIQPSFARGELGPDLYGRVDVAAYAVALRTAINMIVHSYGGASNRPGLMFICPCKESTGTPPALIEFKFNNEDTYILEFGDQYMRVIRNDAQVLESAQTITGATQADPIVVTTSGSHGYSNGDDVYIDSVGGMTQLNNRWFTVANVTGTTFELTDLRSGTDIDGTGYTAYTSGGEASKVYEITTPYAIADVLQIKHKFVQSANVMTLVHPSYEPRELSRTGHAAWSLDTITFAPEQADPTGITVTVNTTGSVTERYQVTAINAETEEESLPGLSNITTGSATATAANPVVVTATGHPYADGDEVELSSFTEMTEVNGRRFIVANSTANTFELEGEDGSGYTAETTGGNINATFVEVTNAAATIDNTVSFTGDANAGKYAVYRRENGIYGLIGETELTTFEDDNISADLSITPPKARNPFLGTDNYPSVASYYQQRRVFANTNNKKDTKYYSVTGAGSNMSHSSPRQADDAITVTLNSLEVNAIEGLVPGNDFIVLTSGAEWRVNAGTEAGFSAETLRQQPQSSWGASYLRPLVVNDKILFNTENGAQVRSLGYEITVDGYKGNDMTVFAPHLLEHFDLIDWALSLAPDARIFGVRDDGWCLCLTFNPEQEVVAWTRLNTDGKFKRVAATRPSSSSKDTLPYFVVERQIGGSAAWYIERLASRRFQDVRDCFFVDSGLSLDVPLAISGVTQADPAVVTTTASHGLSDGDIIDISDVVWEPDVDDHFNYTQPSQLNGGRYRVADATSTTFSLISDEDEDRVDVSTITQADPGVVTTITDHGLSDGDVIAFFNIGGMTTLNGNTYKVNNVTSTTFEIQTVAGADVDTSGYSAYTSGGSIRPAIDSTEYNAYKEDGNVRLTVLTVSNLWHLEGKTIVALCDGNVIENLTVSEGAVTFDNRCSRIHVGIRMIADVETLPPESPRGTIQGKDVRVPFVTVRLKESRGLLIGPNVNNLREMKQREFEAYGEPTSLLTGDKEIPIYSDWSSQGKVYMRQIWPLPMTLTAHIPFIDEGDDDEG